MNYLAHAFLARATPELVTGGFLGDFVKGRVDGRYSPLVCAGIELHRAIDRFTDEHPAVHSARQSVAPSRRRFAGILVDVYFDHFLAKNWSHYSDLSITVFTRSVYDVLWPQRRRLPERLQHMLPWMRGDDWLASYADIESVDAALRGIARRFRYPERARPLADGVTDLVAHYPEFESEFSEFFPQLERYVESQLPGCLSQTDQSTAHLGLAWPRRGF